MVFFGLNSEGCLALPCCKAVPEKKESSAPHSMPIGAFGAFTEGGAGRESAFCSASLKVLFL